MRGSIVRGTTVSVLTLLVAMVVARGAESTTPILQFRWFPLAGVQLKCEVVEVTNRGEHGGVRLTIFGPSQRRLFTYDEDGFESATPLLIPGTPLAPQPEELLLVLWRDGQSSELLVLRGGATGVAVVADYFFQHGYYSLMPLNGAVPAIVTWDRVPDAGRPTAEWPIVGSIHKWDQSSFVDFGSIPAGDLARCLTNRAETAVATRPK